MDFENIDNKLQQQLIEITSKDPYSLSVIMIYNNTTKNSRTLSGYFLINESKKISVTS